MIKKENFKNCIINLGFKELKKDLYYKKYKSFDYEMKVDFSDGILDYGDKVVVNNKTTSNFSHDENFVVFECVDRLIDIGYRPEDIELEPMWTLGHDIKGGRADIVVYDSRDSKKKNKLLFIIECKTYGKEYDKEYKNTLHDGGQLFSYLQQEKSAEWLLIYASDFIDEKVIYQADTIKVTDDKNILELAKKDDTILTYKNANNKEELFEVWDETYEKRFVWDVVFGEEAIAYDIGIKPLKKKDLKDFTKNDNVVNKFEEILRHNNVSDKENAFNRLIALFIAKLADELEKDDNDIVDFQYKVGTDTFETLQDRLQRLHRDGMLNFMNEEITYIDDNYAEDLVRQYTGQKRTKMIESLNNTIKILKFYTNNDFAFKDVHNELLFMQNGQVLLEVVELFQNYKIIGPSQQNAQFLGTMFEQLLNQGFKQNEGQFFTPNQITRFVWESLPIENILFAGERIHYPRVIDYACGAGHFLVQGVNCIKNALENAEKKCDLHPDKYFYGIEKDYRLARVSRVSLYMNNCGKGNVIFGDGLDNYKDKGIDNHKFDILVANPPYSVKEFKSHLKLYNNTLELKDGDYITNKGSEIETCFVERMNQLLKPGGIGAVVLPSSLLNKDGASFNKAREFIVYNFKIRAIVEMGSKTFGATGTNTVILFLEKYNEPPKRISLVSDSIEQIFLGNFNEEFEDKIIFDEYVKVINVDKTFYKKYINKKLEINDIIDNKYFNNILNAYKDTSEYKNKINQASFVELSEKQKNEWLLNSFYKYSFYIEKVKMTYVALTYNQKTLIVSSPVENDAQEKFLGYKWSNRKGQEGIQITKEGGELYRDINSANDYDEIFAADLIKETFNDNYDMESDLLDGKYHYMKTVDMFDFEKTDFNNSINTTINIKIQYSQKYDIKLLKNVSDIVRGVTYEKEDVSVSRTNNIVLTADNITIDGKFQINKEIFIDDNKLFADEKKLIRDDIFICLSSGSKDHVGKVAYINNNTNYFAGGFMGIIRARKEILPKYLYYLLNDTDVKFQLKKSSKGANINNLSNSIGDMKIPIPNLIDQKEIVDAFDEIDKELYNKKSIIDKIGKDVWTLYNKSFGSIDNNINNYKIKHIGDIFELNAGGTPSTKNKSYWENGNISWIGSNMCKNEIIYHNDDKYITEDGLKNSSAKLLPVDTVLVALVGATIGKVALLKFETTINQNILAIQNIREKGFEPLYIYYYMQSIYDEFQKLGSGKFKMANKQFVSNIDILVPPKEVQVEFAKFAEEKELEKQKLIEEKEKLLAEKQELINKYFK